MVELKWNLQFHFQFQFQFQFHGLQFQFQFRNWPQPWNSLMDLKWCIKLPIPIPIPWLAIPIPIPELTPALEFTDGFEMMHKAWCSIEKVPYYFFRSSIKFQGHKGWKSDNLNLIWVRLLRRSQLSNPSDLPFSCGRAMGVLDSPCLSICL